jgi:hypothetical protein
MAAKGGLSLSPNWNQAGSEERVIGRLCRREAVPLTRSGSERHSGLNGVGAKRPSEDGR